METNLGTVFIFIEAPQSPLPPWCYCHLIGSFNVIEFVSLTKVRTAFPLFFLVPSFFFLALVINCQSVTQQCYSGVVCGLIWYTKASDIDVAIEPGGALHSVSLYSGAADTYLILSNTGERLLVPWRCFYTWSQDQEQTPQISLHPLHRNFRSLGISPAFQRG